MWQARTSSRTRKKIKQMMQNTRTYFNNHNTSQQPKIFNMTQKEKLETLTGEKFPEPTPQENYRQQIEGTPFWIIQDKTGYNLIMGKYRMNNTPISSLQEMEKWMNQNQWNIQLSLAICVVTDMLNNQNKQ